MIERTAYRQEILRKLKASPIVSLLGPRQAGKTTLARQIAQGRPTHFFDLEDPVSLARLAAPMSALQPLKGRAILRIFRARERSPFRKYGLFKTPTTF